MCKMFTGAHIVFIYEQKPKPENGIKCSAGATTILKQASKDWQPLGVFMKLEVSADVIFHHH